MSRTSPIQAHCNACGGPRNHRILKKVEQSWDHTINDRYTVWSESEYLMLQCAGCDRVQLRHRAWFSEETDDHGRPFMQEAFFPPSTFRPHPKWFILMDQEWHITKLLREIYSALQNAAPTLAAMGLRAVIEAVMVDKVGDTGSFAGNMKKFQAAGFLSTVQLNSLSAALELGHASTHRKHIPDDFQLEVALDITENLIQGLYLLSHQAQASVHNLPPRKA